MSDQEGDYQLLDNQQHESLSSKKKKKKTSKGNFLVATIVKVPPGAKDSKPLKSSTI